MMAPHSFLGLALEFSAREFLRQHIVVAALLASAAWFYAGQQYLTKGNGAGLLWQGIGILLFCISAIVSKEWASLVVATIATFAEGWLIHRGWAKKYR
jgi:hypothetical protein